MKDLTIKALFCSELPIIRVFHRLNYRKNPDFIKGKNSDEAGELKAKAWAKYETMITQMIKETRVRTFYLEKPIEIKQHEVKISEYGFAGRLVRERCVEAESVFIIGASVLREDFNNIQKLQDEGEMEKAVVLDAVLSEKVEFALDFIEKEATVELNRTGRYIGRRFSCGYSDFSLQYQHFFYKILEFEKYGIKINDKSILFPEKTVTALLPVFSTGESK